MDWLILAAWLIVQAVIFSASIWFVVFGIRLFTKRIILSIGMFVAGFVGLIFVVTNFHSVSAETVKGEPIKVAEHKTRKSSLPVKEFEIPQEVEVTEDVPPLISISEQDAELLARLVEAEAKGETYEGKVAVAVVVLNRVLSDKFPNDVRSVIYQRKQFSPVTNGSINNKASEDSCKAVKEALERMNNGNTYGSLYFYNPRIAKSSWHESKTKVATIGNHVFLK